MGLPMASRLVKAGYSLKVWNRTPEKAAPLVDDGAQFCSGPSEAVAGAKFVCLCLTDSSAIQRVLFAGAEKYVAADTTILDFSTIGIQASRDFAIRLASTTGACWLDCPVSGGVAGAKAGALSIFAGGDPGALDQAGPLLACVASRVTRMGDVGAGQAAKLCNQLIVATNLLSIAEAIALGETLSVDITRLPAAFQGGFADSRPLQIFGPRMAADRDPGPAVAELRTMYKDITAILEEAAQRGFVPPLLDWVRSRYRQLIDKGVGGEDLPVLMRLYRDGRRDNSSTT